MDSDGVLAIDGRLRRLRKAYSKWRYELQFLRSNCYSDFVHREHCADLAAEIPVFVFHSVQPADLEEKLAYLVANGYHTCSADELHQHLTGKKPPLPKTVVLTFDDGHRSLWNVAFPLLRKYGLVGVAFIVPRWVKDGSHRQPSLDAFDRKTPLRENTANGQDSSQFISWQEAKEMHASGHVDIQSHTLTHGTVFTSDSITDFLNPRSNRGLYGELIPPAHINGQDDQSTGLEFGRPLYTSAPRLAGVRRYFEDQCLSEECIRFVVSRGGTRFFRQPNWRKQLLSVAERYRAQHSLRHQHESLREMQEAILYELREAKGVIEHHLPDKSVKHLCYPFFAGNSLPIALCKRAGYVASFWGWDVSAKRVQDWRPSDPYGVGFSAATTGWELIEGRRSNRPGDDPYRTVRLPGDYIHRLPGKGRRPLLQIIAMKCLRGFRKLSD